MGALERDLLREAVDRAALDLLALMPELATITRPAPGTDDFGHPTGGEVTVAIDVPCRYKRLTGREAEDAARVADGAQWSVTVPRGTDLQATDTLTVGGHTFRVAAVVTGTFALERKAYAHGGPA